MSMTLGEKLRQARESRGMSISEVAEQTRISAMYLQSIENDDYRPLPGGIFNKGFVKSFARFVGVDEQEALQDYTQLMAGQDVIVDEDPKTYRPEVLTDDRSALSSLPTIIIAVVILGLMTAGVLVLVNYLQNNPAQPANTVDANKTNANAQMAQTNANVAPTLPATDKIEFQFKALSDPISIRYWIDGKMTNKTIAPNEPLDLSAQQTLKIAYYKGFTADKIQLSLNGKQIAAPPAPAKGSTLTFEINKNNIAQILQSGQIGAVAVPTPKR